MAPPVPVTSSSPLASTSAPATDSQPHATDSQPHSIRLEVNSSHGTDEESNGHCSPDSGVNDLTDSSSEQRAGATAATAQQNPASKEPYTLMVYLGEGERLDINNSNGESCPITGPGAIRMVSHNGPPSTLPMNGPPGHVIRQIVNEQSHVTHIMMGRQNPPYMNGSGHPPVAPGYPQSGGSPLQLPPGYRNHFHHHPIPNNVRQMLAANPQNATPPGPRQQKMAANRMRMNKNNNSSHPVRHPTVYNNTAGGNYQSNFPMNINCVSPQSSRGDRASLDMYSCSSSTDSHDTNEDERRALYEALSAIALPKVEIESRRATIFITHPVIAETNQPGILEVLFTLQYAEKTNQPITDDIYKNLYHGEATEIKMEDLKPVTDYFVRVSASYDGIQGKETEPVEFRTKASIPDRPRPPDICSKAKNYMMLKFHSVNGNGSRITQYILQYYKGQNQDEFIECYRGKEKEYKLTKLEPHTCYTFRIAAVNEIGQSEFSVETHQWTKGSVPPAPEVPRLSEATLNSLLLTWIKRPNVDRDFSLEQDDQSTGLGFLPAYAGSEVSCKLSNLKKSTNYKFRLRSRNEQGLSPWSQTVTFKTKSSIPSIPQRLRVRGVPTSSYVKLYWEPPIDDGGSVVTMYLTQLDSKQIRLPLIPSNEVECSCADLLPGFTYQARVHALNQNGASNWSAPVSFTTKPVAPSAPAAPQLVGKPRAHSIHIKWRSPDSTGGAPVSEYLVELVYMDDTIREVYRGKEVDCVVAGLLPGSMYLVQVKAINSAGIGLPSEPLQVKSGAGAPEAPAPVSLEALTAHSIKILWSMPNPNGAQITEYRLECLKTSGAQHQLIYNGPNLMFEYKGLQAATEYSFRVTAVNSSGLSPASDENTIKTLPSSPSAVTHIKAVPEAERVTVTWKEPNDNGSPITGYQIEYNGRTEQLIVPADEFSYTIENLLPNTMYRIRVQAINEVGVGPIGSPAKATTLSLPPTPPCLESQGVTWNTIKLRWKEHENVTSYTVRMCRAASSSHSVVYNGSALQCKVNKLNENINYQFTISAHNEAGEGPMSNPLCLRTARTPPHSIKQPTVSTITETSCLIEWLSAKSFPGDEVHYRLTLSIDSNQHYKQVYQGSDIRYHLTGLTENTIYSVKVCPVRLCKSGDIIEQEISGAFSPSTSFSTLKPEPVKPNTEFPPSPSTSQMIRQKLRQAFESVKPEEDKQRAILILVVLLIISVILAALVQNFVI